MQFPPSAWVDWFSLSLSGSGGAELNVLGFVCSTCQLRLSLPLWLYNWPIAIDSNVEVNAGPNARSSEVSRSAKWLFERTPPVEESKIVLLP